MISTSSMALLSLLPKTAPHALSLTNPSSSTPLILPFSFQCLPHPLPSPLSSLKATFSDGGDNLRGKPLVPQAFEEEDDDDDNKWVDWEDLILEDTVPLVGFVRMILHSGHCYGCRGCGKHPASSYHLCYVTSAICPQCYPLYDIPAYWLSTIFCNW
ncbi:hypothetical protein D0Y65_013684 [Glycine soja]|uniref:Uncharacterized protein n=1 Tax=Glycine soja TaxID=3848 RepID=A0A445K4L6_GLYSO|nr:hypothetical protein D0Y65_013684 [Glycine soja]